MADADPRGHQLAHALATAYLGGAWTPAGMLARAGEALAHTRAPSWLRQLTAQVHDFYPVAPVDAPRQLVVVIRTRPAWPAARRRAHRHRPIHWEPTTTEMAPVAPVSPPWAITRLDDVGTLAALLNVTLDELAWFADVRGLEAGVSESALRHYRVLTRRKAGGSWRILEVPKPRLREIQRRLLRHVLRPIPLHPSAHGGVAGRSVATALAPHAGHRTVLRCDLESFFPSIAPGRVWGILRLGGLPEAVAHVITGLVTTSASRAAWAGLPPPPTAPLRAVHERLGRRLAAPHLPTGAPSSVAVANLVAFALDRRLSALAAVSGLTYSRYVDDLIFSGDELRTGKVITAVRRIAADEGFTLAEGKSVALSRSQSQRLLGAVVNEKVSVPRDEIDRLRAVLHNCKVQGWASQSRGRSAEQFRSHLSGRVAWVHGVDARRGARLRAALDEIEWPP